jgi:hypothetical protein
MQSSRLRERTAGISPEFNLGLQLVCRAGGICATARLAMECCARLGRRLFDASIGVDEVPLGW